jgi:hypothetical protein
VPQKQGKHVSIILYHYLFIYGFLNDTISILDYAGIGNDVVGSGHGLI